MLDLIPTVTTSFVTAMAANSMKGAKGPAQALDDIMSLVGFEKLHFYAEKKRAENEVYIKDYKEKIAQELVKIPEENIQEPPLSIVGPALEASKFYIEEEELRNMFAKLIAASMDKSKENIVHNSYVEIIKQMSPLDAKILSYINNNNFNNRYPICKVLIQSNNLSGSKVLKSLFLVMPNFDNDLANAASISNLKRLGLIDISFDTWLTNDSLYETIENSDVGLFLKTSYLREDELLTHHVKFQRGIIEINPYGENFIETCL